MILEESELMERMESPLNLLNRLKSSLAGSADKKNIIPSIPSSSELVDNIEDKLKIGSLKSRAAAIMSTSLDLIQEKLIDVKPERLVNIVDSMNKVITAETDKNRGLEKPQIVVYCPQFVEEANFETVYVKE